MSLEQQRKSIDAAWLRYHNALNSSSSNRDISEALQFFKAASAEYATAKRAKQ